MIFDMTLDPFLAADPQVQLHAISAFLALVLGPLIFLRRKGDTTHKLLGRIWVGAMVLTISSSYFIFQIRLWGPFSPIHLISIYASLGLAQGIYYARKGNIAAHRSAMRGLYLGGLLIAGTFTFLPGRLLNRVVFGPNGEAGFYLLLGGVAIIIGLVLLQRRLAIFELRGLRRGRMQEGQ